PFLKDIFSKIYWLKRVILLLFSMLFFSGVFLDLYVDSMLGVLFGFATLYYLAFDRKEDAVYRTAAVSVVVFLLALIKDVGGLFALGVCILILADCLFFRRHWKSWIHSAIPLAFVLFSMFSWSLLITGRASVLAAGALGASKSATSSNVVASASDAAATAANGGLEQWQKDVIPEFIRRFIKQRSGFLDSAGFSLLIFVAMMLLIGFANHMIGRKSIKRTLLWTGGISLGMIAYSFVLVYTFMFLFVRHQGESLWSYDRYILTYQIALPIVGSHFFLPFRDYDTSAGILKDVARLIKHPIKIITSWKKRLSAGALTLTRKQLKSLWRFLGAAVSIVFVVYMSATKLAVESGDFMRDMKASHTPRKAVSSAEKWVPYLREDSLPVFVLSNQSSFTSTIFQIFYAFLDTEVNTTKIAFNTPDGSRTIAGTTRFYHRVVTEDYIDSLGGLSPNDMYTMVCTPDEWAEFLHSEGYGTVYVYLADDNFRENFGGFFTDGVQDDMLYRINYTDAGMTLTPVIG
ncbi:MAG: hypothetical protein FWE86_00735, partial [Oscillospiraceae bacterium]|nr:hypothetical protein [Oscillospiraceae bacterium]